MGLKEECGVFGILGHSDAARLTYLGLYALQHRGQESAGIVAYSGRGLRREVGLGLVSRVFDPKKMDHLRGSLAVGHVRYSTAGNVTLRNAQPFVAENSWGPMALAHNGNLTNVRELALDLERRGERLTSTSDSEVILKRICAQHGLRLEEALSRALQGVEGAYSLVLAAPGRLIAIRDPGGFRPLGLGRLGSAYVLASETCAFDLIGARYIRDVAPGEILIADRRGLHSFPGTLKGSPCFCVFEFVYFSKPDSRIFDSSVYRVRKEMGRQLAREAPARAEAVIPIPDSAMVHAIGYAEESGLPLEAGLVRSHYVGRTFIEPKQSIRDFRTRLKYNVIRDAVEGKRIVLVDDSIVRGTTCRKLVRLLYEAGAKEIHMRIGSPPILSPCFYGIDTPTRKELIASKLSVEQIRDFISVDSLAYLSLEGMLRATGMNPSRFCTACFTGRYPVDSQRIGALLAGERKGAC